MAPLCPLAKKERVAVLKNWWIHRAAVELLGTCTVGKFRHPVALGLIDRRPAVLLSIRQDSGGFLFVSTGTTGWTLVTESFLVQVRNLL